MVKTHVDFTLPTRVAFGSGKLVELCEEISRCGFKRVALITSKDLVELKLAEKAVVEAERGGAKALVFSEVKSNPTTALVTEGVKVLKPFAPDCLVGLGGGSAIDLAKGIGICLSHGTADIKAFQGSHNVRTASVPIICIPTTAGTGSEVNYWAVISDLDTKEKLSIGHPAMSPHLAIVDPELTVTLPPNLTLWTGLDALSHAVEAYFSTRSNRLFDVLSLEAVSMIIGSIDRAVKHGEDLKVRENMSLASLLAGVAMQSVGLGLIHAMSHQVSGFYDTPHGLANAVLMPQVLNFNAPSCLEKADALDGLCGEGLSFMTWIERMLSKHCIGSDSIEILESDIPTMAKRAKSNVNARTNPKVATIEDITEVYRKSFRVCRADCYG